MSFQAIRSIAYSSLNAAQLRMQVASSNVANADVDGYTRKTATQTSTVTAGVGSGTAITGISASVDKYLLGDLLSAATELGAANTADSYASSLGSLFGAVSSDDTGTSLSDLLASLQSALSSLSGTPESDTLAAQAIDAFDNVASALREASGNVQDLRQQADGQIADDIDTVNDALSTIADLNKQIVAAKARGDSTADLEDQRNTALSTIAGLMDVNYHVASDGSMSISTSGGTALLDSQVHALSYDEAGTVTAGTSFADIMVGGRSVTGDITSGTIGALLDQRDETLPDVQSELDALATQLASAVNAVYNTMTAVPPPSTLSGTRGVAASDALSASGTVRIAVTDSDGNLVDYQDLDLSDYATVGDLVDALNGIPGVTADLSSGSLTLSTSSGQGIAIAGTGDSIGSGEGFSEYFGLNDLLTGSGAADIAVRSDLLSSSSGFSTATLDATATPVAGDSVISVSSDTIDQLYQALLGDQDFAAAGGLSARSASLADYAAAIVSKVADAASSATSDLTSKQSVYDSLSDSFSSQTGVNLDEETANLNSLEQEYSVSAQLLSVLSEMFSALLQAAQS